MRGQIPELLELSEMARRQGEQFPRRRDLYHEIRGKRGRHFSGIVGPRGVGKTVLLKQMAASDPDCVYVSVDTMKGLDLFDVIRRLHQDHGFGCILLDEVHFHDDFDGELKKAHDFLDVRVVFTSSTALSMRSTAHDLSRRVRLHTLAPFSLRERLLFENGEQLPRLGLDDIWEGRWSRRHARAVSRFESYLRGGLMPFSLQEPEVLPLLSNILEKILIRDIPRVASLLVEEIDIIRRMLEFVGRAQVDGINYSSLSRNLGITKYKSASYVRLLEQAYVLRQVFPRGANVMREPKILMSLPYRLLYMDYDDALGGLREDFTAEMLHAAGIEFHYLKSTRGAKTPDFLVSDGEGPLVIEVGGKGKGRSQFKGIEAPRKMILSHDPSAGSGRRPLHLLGFLY